MTTPIHIDGSYGESGGAMLRQALGFSMLTGLAFTMDKIRVGREKPGLSYQHLTALNAAHQASKAQVQGNVLRSTEISFTPGKIDDVKLAIDIGTAGSITLLLQTFLLPAVFSGKKFELSVIGGTDVQWSIPIDYFSEVLLPQLRKYAETQVRLHKRGYYPKGEGKVTFTSKGKFTLGKKMIPITLDKKGTLFKIRGMSFASTTLEKSEVALRQAKAARIILSQEKVEVDIMHRYSPSSSMGSGIVLWGVCGDEEGLHPNNPVLIGANALGDKKIKSEDVGKEAAEKLLERLRSQAPCDEHLADQLIPFLAIAGGRIQTETISNHLRSNIYVAQQFLEVDFDIDEERCIISCEGIQKDFI